MSDTDTWALPYQRLPLGQSKKEVRLIEFHFKDDGDDFFTKAIDMDEEAKKHISLRMVKASLLQPPKFRALSYVWGPSKEGRRITLQVPKNADLDIIASTEEEPLENCEIEVTDNLFSALVHYRTMSSEDKPAYFWIDALCINQRDKDEKSWQVAMMRDVYRSAHMVMAWLGPYPEPVYYRPGELIKTFEVLADEGLARFGRPVYLPLSVFRTASNVRFAETDIVEWVRGVKVVPGPFSRANGDGTYQISEWALTGFQNLAFWSRVWILQEVMLADYILFTWAGWSISSEELFTALRIVAKALQVAGRRGPLSSTQGIGDVLPSKKPWIRATNSQETTLSPMLDKRHDRDGDDRDGKNGLWDLIHWNAICAGLQASMPADHVFGLFGVANDVEELGIRLDYNRDVADIYTEMASSCIKKEGLIVLADVQWPKKVVNLPSWVPDWSALSSTGTRAGIWSSYGALPSFISKSGVGNDARSRPYKFTVSSAGLPTLVVGGNTITTVQYFLPSMRDASGENPRLIRRVWNIQAKLLAAKDTIERCATAYRTLEDRHTAFASTIVAGGWERGRVNFEDQWSLSKLVEGYRLLLDPLSAETSLNALWRRQSPFRQMVLHAMFACFEISESFLNADPRTVPVPEIDGVPAAELCRHPGLYYRISFDDYADKVLGSLVDVEGAEHVMANIAIFLDRMEEVGQGTRLFLSAGGYLGLGPAEMQIGDVVAYLDNAEVPFILRPLSTGEYSLVGETYVYGLMDRDAKTDDPSQGMIPFISRPSPELGATIHHCPEGDRREFVIV